MKHGICIYSDRNTFFNVELAMPWVVYMIFAAFVMVATVNAVNLMQCGQLPHFLRTS